MIWLKSTGTIRLFEKQTVQDNWLNTIPGVNSRKGIDIHLIDIYHKLINNSYVVSFFWTLVFKFDKNKSRKYGLCMALNHWYRLLVHCPTTHVTAGSRIPGPSCQSSNHKYRVYKKKLTETKLFCTRAHGEEITFLLPYSLLVWFWQQVLRKDNISFCSAWYSPRVCSHNRKHQAAWQCCGGCKRPGCQSPPCSLPTLPPSLCQWLWLQPGCQSACFEPVRHKGDQTDR